MIAEIAKKRIGEVIRTDTIASNQADFLATHVPLSGIHIKKKWDSKIDQTLTEEQVFNKYVLNTQNEHQFIIVIGSSGAGKSHLIRWFAARLEQSLPDDEVVLFVRRSDNSLKGTIKQLLELPEVSNIPNKAVYDRLVRATSTIDNKKLRDMIYQNFIVEIKNDESDEILSNNEKKRLIALLQDEQFQNQLMKEESAIERIYQKVAENETGDSRDVIALFEPKDFYVDVDFCDDLITNGAAKNARKMADTLLADEEMPTRLADYMNTLVNKVIQLCAGLEPGDFEQVFIEIRKEIKKQGKNLTLLIEDITAFTGVNVALLNVLTTEHTGMYEVQELCRVSSIVGTTEKYFNVNFMDNHKDRVTQFISIPNDVFGANPEKLYEFVGRYLNTMSINSEVLESWAKDGAMMNSYPIHQHEERAQWDSVVLAKGKELDLFPFTKKAILNLYTCILQPDYRTPRYLLRDVVERVVRNYLYKKESFPEFTIEHMDYVQMDWETQEYIRQNVNEKEVERVSRFVRIWGDATANAYIDNETGIEYVGGLPKEYYSDLDIPCFEGRITGKNSVVEIKKEVKTVSMEEIEKQIVTEPEIDPAMSEFMEGQKTLEIWIDGGTLNVGATTKGVINITKARDEINKRFLISAINWQAEGVSLDNLNKVKSTKDFIGFERQKRGAKDALVVLPANRETQGVMEAFLAYVTLGHGSWNFKNSAMMVYRVQIWVEKWKDKILKEINNFNNHYIDYHECAIAIEMIREIMQGIFIGTKIEGIPVTNLMAKNLKKQTANSHCSEWNTVTNMILNTESKIKDVIIQYFNIPQGVLASKLVFVRYSEFETTVKKVQKQRLFVPEDVLMENDPIPQRREIREILEKLQTRLPKVSEAEKNKAQTILGQLGLFIDYKDIDDEDIEDLVEQIKKFYTTANDAMFNIHCDQTGLDKLKKDAKTICVAIKEVLEALEKDDCIDVLMRFSKDPLSKIERFLSVLTNVNKDMIYVNNDIVKRREKITIVKGDGLSSKYKEEKETLIECGKIVSSWEARI